MLLLLHEHNGHQQRAAEVIGIGYRTLCRKLRRYRKEAAEASR